MRMADPIPPAPWICSCCKTSWLALSAVHRWERAGLLYCTWCLFESRRENMDIGEARAAAKAGHRVARKGWNGKDVWIAYSPGADALAAASFWSPANKKYAESQGGYARVLPCFTMKTADGAILMGWMASQSDLDADDWFVVGDEYGADKG